MKIMPLLLVLFLSSILYGCSKNGPDNPISTIPGNPETPAIPNNPETPNKPDTTDRSKKQINAVIFRTLDNPSLAYDISAVISSDTVKCLFAPYTALTNLIPDISFLGKSIAPANKTVRDFSSPVAYTVTAEDGTAKQYVFSCSVADSATMLVGKWRLVKDSSTNNNFVTTDGTYIFPGVYIGKAEDYFEFTSNGIFNMHANNQTGGGFKYSLKPNARLYIDIMSPQLDDGYVLTLTPHNATLFWTKTSSNGGKYTRTTWLKR